MNKLEEPKDTTIDDITEPALVKILCELSIKTLGQCVSVRRPWYSLIKRRAFISAHLSLDILDSKDYEPLLIIKYVPGWWCDLLLKNQQVEEYMRLRTLLSLFSRLHCWLLQRVTFECVLKAFLVADVWRESQQCLSFLKLLWSVERAADV